MTTEQLTLDLELENEVVAENTPNVVFWFKKGDGVALYRKNPLKWVHFVRSLSNTLGLGWAARYYAEGETLPEMRSANERQLVKINAMVTSANRQRRAA